MGVLQSFGVWEENFSFVPVPESLSLFLGGFCALGAIGWCLRRSRAATPFGRTTASPRAMASRPIDEVRKRGAPMPMDGSFAVKRDIDPVPRYANGRTPIRIPWRKKANSAQAKTPAMSVKVLPRIVAAG